MFAGRVQREQQRVNVERLTLPFAVAVDRDGFYRYRAQCELTIRNTVMQIHSPRSESSEIMQ